MATHVGEGGSFLLSLSIDILISSRNTLIETPEIKLYQLSGDLLAQSH